MVPGCCQHRLERRGSCLFTLSWGATPCWVQRVVVFSRQPDRVGKPDNVDGEKIALIKQAVLAKNNMAPEAVRVGKDRWFRYRGDGSGTNGAAVERHGGFDVVMENVVQ